MWCAYFTFTFKRGGIHWIEDFPEIKNLKLIPVDIYKFSKKLELSSPKIRKLFIHFNKRSRVVYKERLGAFEKKFIPGFEAWGSAGGLTLSSLFVSNELEEGKRLKELKIKDLGRRNILKAGLGFLGAAAFGVTGIKKYIDYKKGAEEEKKLLAAHQPEDYKIFEKNHLEHESEYVKASVEDYALVRLLVDSMEKNKALVFVGNFRDDHFEKAKYYLMKQDFLKERWEMYQDILGRHTEVSKKIKK